MEENKSCYSDEAMKRMKERIGMEGRKDGDGGREARRDN